MKNLKITVNGVVYDVQVEEADGSAAPAAAASSAAPAPKVAPKASPAAVKGEEVKAPMPGTVLNIPVKVGQSVKTGDVLVVIEAMKMENEIKAGHDAVVASVAVSKGESVDTGAVLVVLN